MSEKKMARVPRTVEQRIAEAKRRGLKGKIGSDTERLAKNKFTRWAARLVGKGSYYQNKGYMKKYLPAATTGAPSAKYILDQPWGKTVDRDNAIDSISNTLNKTFGKIANALFGSPLMKMATEKIVDLAKDYAPVVQEVANKLQESGLKTHQVNTLILSFRNAVVDAVLEEYQKEQLKLPEEDREPISKDDVAALFATRKEMAEWMKDDLTGIQKGKDVMPNTERITKAIGEMEDHSGKSPGSLKSLQNDTLQTIRELHSLGLIDEKALFNWLK